MPPPRRVVTRSSARASAGVAAAPVSAGPPSSATTFSRTIARGSKRESKDETLVEKKKKPRPSIESSSTSVRSYNLRSTTARKASAVASVTPASATGIARQILFTTSPGDASLPPGVVNIYDLTQPQLKRPVCQCPSDISYEKDTAAAFAHIATYGEEYDEVLKAKETRQTDDLLARLPRENHGDRTMPVRDNDSIASGDTKKSDDSPASWSSSRPTLSPPSEQKSLPRQPHLSARMRGILVNWLVEVSHEYKMSNQALHLSITLLDHILLRGPTEHEFEEWDEEHDEDEEPEWFYVPRQLFQALGWYGLFVLAALLLHARPFVSHLDPSCVRTALVHGSLPSLKTSLLHR